MDNAKRTKNILDGVITVISNQFIHFLQLRLIINFKNRDKYWNPKKGVLLGTPHFIKPKNDYSLPQAIFHIENEPIQRTIAITAPPASPSPIAVCAPNANKALNKNPA